MKKTYPDYKGQTLDDVFNSFSKHNKDIINSYIDYCRKDAKETTLYKYFSKIVQIADIIEKPLDTLTLEDVNKFQVLLNLSNRGTDTINDIKKTLKRFIKWKYDDWNIKFKGLGDVKQKKKGSSEKLTKQDLLTKEELEILIRSAETLRFKSMIMLMYESACRPEECFKLKWSDVDFQDKEVNLNSAKTGEARIVPIEESILHLKRYYQEYPYPNVKSSDLVFPSVTDRNKPISTQYVNDYFKKLALRTIKKPLYPYIFRHTRLQEIRSKLTTEAYQKIAGHSYEMGLQSYGHLDIKEAKDEMLSKVYHIEELTKEEKGKVKKLQEELKKQGEIIKQIQKEDFEIKNQILKMINGLKKSPKKYLQEVQKNFIKEFPESAIEDKILIKN